MGAALSPLIEGKKLNLAVEKQILKILSKRRLVWLYNRAYGKAFWGMGATID